MILLTVPGRFMPRKYRIKESGDIVYDLVKPDHGLANQDTRETGIEHKSVTLDENGDYPSFIIPINQLEEIHVEP